MNVVLVIPPDVYSTKGFLPHYGLASIAACLEKCGFNVSILDFRAEKVPITKEAFHMVRSQPIDAVGITATTHSRFEAMKVAEIAKNDLGAFTFVGGKHFAETAEDGLRCCPSIDVIVREEGEITAVELLQQNFREQTYQSINGISFRDESGKIKHNPDRPLIMDLDSLPQPAWHLYNHGKYTTLLEGGYQIKSVGVMSSRGCPFQCVFCANSQRVLRFRNPSSFIDEVEYLHHEYGYQAFDFWDDTFTVNHDHVTEICHEIMRRNLCIKWYARARVNTVNKEILKLMKEAGCVTVSYGVESGSERILKNIRKNITLSQVRDVVKMSSDMGFTVKLFFMRGNPGETLLDMRMTTALQNELARFPNVKISSAYSTIYPGTELEKIAKRRGMLPEDFSWNTPQTFFLSRINRSNPTIPLFQESKLSVVKFKLYTSWIRIRKDFHFCSLLEKTLNFLRRMFSNMVTPKNRM